MENRRRIDLKLRDFSILDIIVSDFDLGLRIFFEFLVEMELDGVEEREE